MKNKKRLEIKPFFVFGGDSRIRTYDPFDVNEVL